ncbi:MAG: class I SAM-dependent DNA methyltransferase [Acidimicrobiales bacterium]
MSYPKGSAYDERVAKLASTGAAMHGEADLVEAFLPRRVLDAGCGTGRVAVELARRGMDVVGVDCDAEMLEAARAKPEAVEWLLGDLSNSEVLGGRAFDLVVMAGNVMIFVEAGTEADVVTTVAGALGPAGVLVAGFSLVPGRIGLDDYDRACRDAGLELTARWSSWDRAEFSTESNYAVSVHRPHPEAPEGMI